MHQPSDRHAVVSGAASGLGRAVVERLRSAGWKVAGLDLSGAVGDITMDVDVTEAEQLTSAVNTIAAEFGGIDGLAHCAGVFPINGVQPVHLLDEAIWDLTIGVNLTGSFNMARATLPHLMKSKGALVLISSTGADYSQPGGSAYSASKAGVRALARSIALEYAIHGVRACSVSPGYMRTGMTEKVLSRPDILATIEANVPLGRVSDPLEVANLVAFFLSDEAGFLTGEDVTVDGGGGLHAAVGNTEVSAMWSKQERRAARAAAVT